MLIYKILRPAEWDAFEAAGVFNGSEDDHDSGFIHLSSPEQVATTAHRIFAEDPVLVLAAVDTEAVADALRWEESSDHGSFPHLYAPLPRSAVVAVHRVAGAAAVEEALPKT